MCLLNKKMKNACMVFEMNFQGKQQLAKETQLPKRPIVPRL